MTGGPTPSITLSFRAVTGGEEGSLLPLLFARFAPSRFNSFVFLQFNLCTLCG
jgi:hypothetical protein